MTVRRRRRDEDVEAEVGFENGPRTTPAPVHPAGWPKRQSVRLHAMPLLHGLVFLLLLWNILI